MKHMKRLVSIAAAGFLLAAGIAIAQSASDSANTNAAPVKKVPLLERVQEKAAELKDARANAKAQLLEKKDELQQKRDMVKEEAVAKRTEVKEKLQAKKVDVKEKMVTANKARVEKVIKVLEDRVTNLSEFITRIEAHIAKLVAAGTDTTAANTLLVTAKSKVAEADASVDGLYGQVETALTTANQKVALQAVTTAARNTEAKVKAAHAAIVDVINSLKPGKNTANPAPASQ